MRHLVIAAFVAASAITTAAALAAGPKVPYPVNYRNWTHIKSMVISEGHPLFESFGGIHHIYGNKAAQEGYARGRFADGATIVFDLLEVKTEGGATTEGARKVVGVMEKDKRKFAKTGGWGFEAFKGDTRERIVGENAASACFACHESQKATDYVFSTYRP